MSLEILRCTQNDREGIKILQWTVSGVNTNIQYFRLNNAWGFAFQKNNIALQHQ